jgi:peptidoglycan/xylan/chitin deacetylase (PgdA/CDA1 family)
MTTALVSPLIPILLYHSISEDATRRYRPYAIDPGRFREQMEAIAEGGFRTLTVTELASMLADPTAQLPERCLLITFDDGFEEVHRIALPILAGLGLRATAFLVSGYIGGTSRWLESDGEGGRRLVAWPQVRELARAGFEIGSHSHTHPQLDTLTIRKAEAELRRSRQVLEEGLGSPVTSFAYPHGYHSPRIRELVRANGYSAGCAVKHALSHAADDPWALGRVVVSADTPADRFAAWIDGRGLPAAWSGERSRTIAWRIVRRTRARLRGSPSSRGTAAAI